MLIAKYLQILILFSSYYYYSAKCQPESYNLCKDFAVQFDRVYEAAAQNGIVIEGDTVNSPNNPGMFYIYDNEAWEAYFGSGVSARMDFDGKQCRNGAAVYTGKISAFPPTSSYGYLGRRCPEQPVSGCANTGDWQPGDVIVKSSDECVSEEDVYDKSLD